MKRLIWSVVAGLGIPFLYSITVGPLSTSISNERTNFLLWIPIGWPNILLFLIFPLGSANKASLGGEALFAINILSNMILYGALSYFLLLWRDLRRVDANTELPPEPPF